MLGALLPLPWYAYLAFNYENPFLGRKGWTGIGRDAPAVTRAQVDAASFVPPLAALNPLSYYVSGGLPETFTEPHRGELRPRFLPILYTETWGDYFGVWSWGVATTRPEMSPSVNRRLELQSFAGVLPTFLALTGWLALLALVLVRARERADLFAVALVPLAGFTAVLYYATRYPSTDGDTMKGMFLLPAIPCLAVAFGFAADSIRARTPRLGWPLIAVLAVCAAVSLHYGIA